MYEELLIFNPLVDHYLCVWEDLSEVEGLNCSPAKLTQRPLKILVNRNPFQSELKEQQPFFRSRLECQYGLLNQLINRRILSEEQVTDIKAN